MRQDFCKIVKSVGLKDRHVSGRHTEEGLIYKQLIKIYKMPTLNYEADKDLKRLRKAELSLPTP